MKKREIKRGMRSVTVKSEMCKPFRMVIEKKDAFSYGSAWALIKEYVNACNVIFTKLNGVYMFEFPDCDAETFATFSAAARFARYNLNEMEKAGVNDEII